jgi:hypothetical protein
MRRMNSPADGEENDMNAVEDQVPEHFAPGKVANECRADHVYYLAVVFFWAAQFLAISLGMMVDDVEMLVRNRTHGR